MTVGPGRPGEQGCRPGELIFGQNFLFKSISSLTSKRLFGWIFGAVLKPKKGEWTEEARGKWKSKRLEIKVYLSKLSFDFHPFEIHACSKSLKPYFSMISSLDWVVLQTSNHISILDCFANIHVSITCVLTFKLSYNLCSLIGMSFQVVLINSCD